MNLTAVLEPWVYSLAVVHLKAAKMLLDIAATLALLKKSSEAAISLYHQQLALVMPNVPTAFIKWDHSCEHANKTDRFNFGSLLRPVLFANLGQAMCSSDVPAQAEGCIRQ